MTYPHPPQVDLHVHTVASGHAYSTINEIAQVATVRGLRAVGMTDHGPALPGGPHPYHFAALRFVPQEIGGVRILRGIEANILAGGDLDLEERALRTLDLVLAGFHEECGPEGGEIAVHTAAVMALLERRIVHVLTHPGNPVFPLDVEAVVAKAVETGTAIEINNASFGLSRCGSSDNCRRIAACCAERGALVAINSDAHIAQGVGEFDRALATAAAAGIRWEQIVNRTLESTLRFLDTRAG